MIPDAVLSLLGNLVSSTHNCRDFCLQLHPPTPMDTPWTESHHPHCCAFKFSNFYLNFQNHLVSFQHSSSGLIILAFAFPLLNQSLSLASLPSKSWVQRHEPAFNHFLITHTQSYFSSQLFHACLAKPLYPLLHPGHHRLSTKSQNCPAGDRMLME